MVLVTPQRRPDESGNLHGAARRRSRWPQELRFARRPHARNDNRVPPHNLDAEESLLGALLLSREVVGKVAELGLQVDHFYKPAHQHVYAAIRGLMATGQPVDVVTVADELRRTGLLDEIGGAQLLLELQNATPAISNANRYAKIVQDTAVLRRLIGVASEIAEIAYLEPDDVTKALDEAETRGVRGRRGSRHRLDAAARRPAPAGDGQAAGDVRPRRHHHRHRDRLQRSRRDPVRPAAVHPQHRRRPACDGKDGASGSGIATHVATTTKKPVLVFSLEMGHAELTQRILSSEAAVDSQKLRTGRLVDSDWTKIGQAINRLEVPLYLDDNPRVTVMEIRAKARRMKARIRRAGADRHRLPAADERRRRTPRTASSRSARSAVA